mgnify:CR=1 FL=1
MAAYRVVRVNVLDDKKLQAYAPLAAAAVEAHGGRYLARGGAHETTEGIDYARNVMVCWPDMATAQTVYHSPEYQKARDVLGDGADSLFVFVDGLPD